jgi:hypothetical protein
MQSPCLRRVSEVSIYSRKRSSDHALFTALRFSAAFSILCLNLKLITSGLNHFDDAVRALGNCGIAKFGG